MINMLNAKEKAIQLIANACVKSHYLSPILKLDNAKDIVLEQLSVAREFIYISVMIEDIDKGMRKTIDYIDTIKKEVETL